LFPFFPDKRPFPRNPVFRTHQFVPKMSPRLRFAPAPPPAPRASFRASAGFGRRR
jgi:hypothetical protein